MPNLALSEAEYCAVAKRIVERQGDQRITDSDGNPTELYYHVKGCDECKI